MIVLEYPLGGLKHSSFYNYVGKSCIEKIFKVPPNLANQKEINENLVRN